MDTSVDKNLPDYRYYASILSNLTSRELSHGRYVRRTGRDGSTRGDTCIDISYPWDNSPVLILGTTMYPSCGIGGRFQVGNKQQSTSPDKIRNTQKWILLLIKICPIIGIMRPF